MNITRTTTHFTTDHKTAVRGINCTATYYHIFCRHGPLTSGSIATTFHTKRIVTHVEYGIFDQHVLTTFYIDTIAVLSIPWIFHKYISYSKMFTHQWVQAP